MIRYECGNRVLCVGRGDMRPRCGKDPMEHTDHLARDLSLWLLCIIPIGLGLAMLIMALSPPPAIGIHPAAPACPDAAMGDDYGTTGANRDGHGMGDVTVGRSSALKLNGM